MKNEESKSMNSLEVGVKSEWDKAKTVLVFSPMNEVFFGLLHPEGASYEKPFDRYGAAQEHAVFKDILKAQGVDVIDLADVLVSGTMNEYGQKVEGDKLKDLQDVALSSLTYVSASGSDEQLEQYKKQVVESLNPKDLLRVIIERPVVNLEHNEEQGFVVKNYSVDPIMNMYFMRDQQITTDKGSVIGKMKRDVRKPEVDLVKFGLKKLGIEPIYEIQGDGTLEGGDYIPAGDFAMIGQGPRTNAEGIAQLLENDVFDFDEVAVVKDPYQQQDEMHLDTYFNIYGKKKAVIIEDRITDENKKSTVDIYKKLNGEYLKVRNDVDFLDYLVKDKGFEVATITKDQQMAYGINFLCVEDNNVVAVQSDDEYLKTLDGWGVDAKMANLENLTGGYGAAHCMTQVIKREQTN